MLGGFRKPGLESGSAPPPFALAGCSLAPGASFPSRCLASNYIPAHLFIVCLCPEFHQGRNHLSCSRLISWCRTVPISKKRERKRKRKNAHGTKFMTGLFWSLSTYPGQKCLIQTQNQILFLGSLMRQTCFSHSGIRSYQSLCQQSKLTDL